MRLRRFVGFSFDIGIMTGLLKILTLAMPHNISDLGNSFFSVSPQSFDFSSFVPVKFELFSLVRFGIVSLMGMLRDGHNGRGPGKWVAGIQVVNTNGLPIGYIDSLKRNASLLLWPVEGISILFTGVRITDKIFHYEVIKKDKLHWVLRVLLSIGFTTSLFYLLNRIG
jgi:uncharacterized RDD family membrane protein YckC